VAAEVAAPDLPKAFEPGAVAGHVGDEDLHPHQVLRSRAGGGQRGEQVGQRQVELLDEARGDLAAPVRANLAAEEHGAAGGGHHRVREPDRRGQLRRVDDLVRPGHRPLQVGERPSVKAA
jgi:hypothetical protein